jgi:2-polyprenyl-3-methyl-5-hydroxy-6-metoxy-1,4-benzoquinol methylase
MNKKALTDAEVLTIETYNTNADHWSLKNYHQSFWEDDLQLFQRYLASGKVIDIGCGAGTDTESLMAAGYDYTGIDASKKLIENARKFHPHAHFLHKSIYELDFEAHSFDGFLAAAILLHLPKAKIEIALKNIHRIVKPGGVGFISVKKGTGELVATEDSAEGVIYNRLFSFFEADEIKKLLTENGFEILEFNERPYSHSVTWFCIHVKQS